MDKIQYGISGELFTVVQFIPTSESGDSVTIKITRLSDGYTWNFSGLEFENASNSGSMTFLSDSTWKSSFTPDQADTYSIYINNSTKDVDFQQTVVVRSDPIQIPSGSWGAGISVGTNSFVTAAEAETYFATRFGASDHWDALNDAKKTAAIITSYYQLNSVYTLPSPATDNVKRAQLEQALFLTIHGDDALRRKGLQAQGVISAGMVREQYDKDAMGKLSISPEVASMLEDYEENESIYFDDLLRDDDEDVN